MVWLSLVLIWPHTGSCVGGPPTAILVRRFFDGVTVWPVNWRGCRGLFHHYYYYCYLGHIYNVYLKFLENRLSAEFNLGPRANFFSLFLKIWRSRSDFRSPALLTSLLRPSIPVNPLLFKRKSALESRLCWITLLVFDVSVSNQIYTCNLIRYVRHFQFTNFAISNYVLLLPVRLELTAQRMIHPWIGISAPLCQQINRLSICFL